MNRKDTIDKVVDYIKDDDAQYAILISGNWGCGKTYLYRNYLIDAINGNELGKTIRKDNVYISLYGITSLEDLSRELILHFISVKTSKGTGDNEGFVMGTAGILELISKSITFQVKNISVGGLDKIYKKLHDLIKSKNLVICFDDLERCAIPVNELFGWINNLTEHCSCKVIILADEDNIGKMYANMNLENKYQSILNGRRITDAKISRSTELFGYARGTNQSKEDNSIYKEISVEQLKVLNEKVFSENFIYKDIKEKVIGETIYYRPSIEDTVNDLLKSNTGDGACDSPYMAFLRSSSDLIRAELSRLPGGVNYRTVIFWIKKFKRIYDECKVIYGNDNVFLKMLEIYVKASIASVYECKANIMLTHTSEATNLYVQYEYYGSKILTFSFIDSWVKSSSWPGSLFKRACNDVRRLIAIERHRNPSEGKVSQGESLDKLNDWPYKTDQEVEGIISDVINELKEGQYAFYDYPKVLRNLVSFSRLDFCSSKEIDTVSTIMRDMIEKSDEYCELQRSAPQYFDNKDDQKTFDEYYTPIIECAKEHNKKYRRNEAINNKAFSNASEFTKYCADYYDTFYENKSFIGFVGKEEILGLIISSNLEDKYSIIGTVEKVYASINIKEYFSEDLELIKQLKADLEAEGVFGPGKTDKFCKDRFITVLSEVQDKLQ